VNSGERNLQCQVQADISCLFQVRWGFLWKVGPRIPRETAYTTLVRPTLEYASAVCMGPTSQEGHCFARKSPTQSRTFYTELQPIGRVLRIWWKILWVGHFRTEKEKARLALMCMLSHNLIDIDSAKYLITHPQNRTRKNQSIVRNLYASKDVYQFSYFPKTIDEWNCLPDDIVTIVTASSLWILFSWSCLFFWVIHLSLLVRFLILIY